MVHGKRYEGGGVWMSGQGGRGVVMGLVRKTG